MASNAEHQAAWRQRQRKKIAALETELKAVRAALAKLKARGRRGRRPRTAGRVRLSKVVR
jgi:hypothetical protein